MPVARAGRAPASSSILRAPRVRAPRVTARHPSAGLLRRGASAECADGWQLRRRRRPSPRLRTGLRSVPVCPISRFHSLGLVPLCLHRSHRGSCIPRKQYLLRSSTLTHAHSLTHSLPSVTPCLVVDEQVHHSSPARRARCSGRS